MNIVDNGEKKLRKDFLPQNICFTLLQTLLLYAILTKIHKAIFTNRIQLAITSTIHHLSYITTFSYLSESKFTLFNVFLTFSFLYLIISYVC